MHKDAQNNISSHYLYISQTGYYSTISFFLFKKKKKMCVYNMKK